MPVFKVLRLAGQQHGRLLHSRQILGFNYGSKAKVKIWEVE